MWNANSTPQSLQFHKILLQVNRVRAVRSFWIDGFIITYRYVRLPPPATRICRLQRNMFLSYTRASATVRFALAWCAAKRDSEIPDATSGPGMVQLGHP